MTEAIKLKGKFLDIPEFERAITNSLNDIALDVRIDFRVTTQTWHNRPDFVITRPDKWAREVSTKSVIYKYVSRGTKPHIIVPRNAKALAFFRTGFRAKTRVGRIVSLKGAPATKDFTMTLKVHHPGTKAREYEKTIGDKWQKEAPKVLQRALDAEATRQIRQNK